jgi:sec-independent protein translocase protein TatA
VDKDRVEMVFEALTPLFIPGGLGPPELIVILLIFVLLFGANKIPELARSTGEAMGEFQKGRQEVEEELSEMKEEATKGMEEATEGIEDATPELDSELSSESTSSEN